MMPLLRLKRLAERAASQAEGDEGVTFEETQAALSGPRTAGLAAAGLLPLAYRRFWATRMNALGTVYVCQAGPREFVAGSFMGESMQCHLVTPSCPTLRW